jgi:EAL domain-containing protein (putative c-di-GMP-specific phosphodiesterase class I)
MKDSTQPGTKRAAHAPGAEIERTAIGLGRTDAPRVVPDDRVWLLESHDDTGALRRMPIQLLPFRIGRLPGLELVLPSQVVSKTHAELFESDGVLYVRDLHSTNGTFVNRQPVTEAPIREGDILHFADFEFRLGCQHASAYADADRPATLAAGMRALPRGFISGTRELDELIEQEAASVVLQPIVRLPGDTIVAYEVLGRGGHPDLPQTPDALFAIAAVIGAETRLSRLFRRKTVELLKRYPNLPSLFLNTHPAELLLPHLIESIEELRAAAPSVDLIVEIHEGALAQPGFMSGLRGRLAEINVGLAYDDFGAGQARLLELAEAPPSFLKFDRRFVSGIDQAPPSRRRLVASLVAAARELLVKTIAEGVETEAEAEVCRRAGFTHAQGFYFGTPRPPEELF